MDISTNSLRPRYRLVRAIAVAIASAVLLSTFASTAGAVRPGTWETRTPVAMARHEASYVQVDGLLHLVGGKRKQHHVYDPDADSWSKVAPFLPPKVNRVQAVTVGGKIYVIGGTIKWKAPTIESKVVRIYDPATDTWSKGKPMPRPRGAGGVAVYKGKIYYAGGISNSRAVKWLDVYNPAKNTWRRLRNMPVPRQHFQAVVVGGNLYAVGGATYATRKLVKRTDRFNFKKGIWRKKSLRRVPVPVEGAAAAKVAGRVVLFGGVGANGATRAVQAFDPRTGRWTKWARMLSPRHAFQGAKCGAGVYFATGSDSKGRHPTTKNEVFFFGAPGPC
jgi:N-acetylneuraminic acid mutarotase